MGNLSNASDFRNEIHVRIARIWKITQFYGHNSKKIKKLSLNRLNLYDFLLRNEEFIYLLDNKKNNHDNTRTVLYNSNVSYGAHYDMSQTISAVMLLSQLGYIDIERIENEFYCTVTSKEFTIDNNLIKDWIDCLNKIKTINSKSVESLNKKIFEGAI